MSAPARQIWTPQPGPQTRMVLSKADETLAGGQRGGSKSFGLILWFLMGNHDLDPSDPVYQTALNYRRYTALVVRRSWQDLRDWIDQAMEVYKGTGAELKGTPPVFQWKTGAKIYTDHLNDEQAFNKYRGWNLHRIGLEELTEIPHLKWYLRLLGSLRSRKMDDGKPVIRPQIMSTTNPDGPGHCVPYGDVLTTSGWKDIRSVAVGDSVWSVDPKTSEMVSREVTQVHAQLFQGELYHARARGFDLCCTPQHKILRFSGTKGDRQRLVLQQAERLPGQATVVRTCGGWRGRTPDTVSVHSSSRRVRAVKRRVPQPLSLSGAEYAALTGWMVTEGCLVRRDNAIHISQTKVEGRRKLRLLLDTCGFRQNWSPTGVTIYSHEWLDEFSWMRHASEKRVPTAVKQYGREALQAMLIAMVDGDGHWETNDSGTFYTSSPALMSDFCEIALKCGYIVLTGQRQREASSIQGKPASARLPSFEIAFHRQAIGGTEIRSGNHVYKVTTKTKRINVEREPFVGNVYCIGVEDTHTFFIRQNGCVWVSGNSWVKKRFVEVYSGGKRIPPNTLMLDPVTGLTRMFIPMRLEDNKYLGPEYERMLLAQRGESEATFQAWRYGRWDVFAGQFFAEFRPDGPMPGDPPEPAIADHCYSEQDTPLQPWWPVTIGVDWGFNHDAAAYWGRINQDTKRLHVFREHVVRQVGSRQLGQQIALKTLPDLIGLGDNPVIHLFLSHDAFSKEDNTRTRAELFCDGIDDILGPSSAHLAELTDAERKMDPSAALDSMEFRMQKLTGSPCIIVHRARSDRAAMATYVREMLNWREQERKEPDLDYARSLLTAENGLNLYEEYMEKFRLQKVEHLPRVKIERKCERLKQCLTSLIYDPDNTEVPKKINSTPEGEPGDDPYDGFCYLVMGARFTANRKPKAVFIGERIERFRSLYADLLGTVDPVIAHQVLQKAHQDYGAADTGGWISLPRM